MAQVDIRLKSITRALLKNPNLTRRAELLAERALLRRELFGMDPGVLEHGRSKSGASTRRS